MIAREQKVVCPILIMHGGGRQVRETALSNPRVAP